MSVWRSVNDLAKYAAQITVDVLEGEEPPADFFESTVNNGFADIPLKQVPSRVIDASNMDVLIEDGAISKDELCTDEIPAGAGPC